MGTHIANNNHIVFLTDMHSHFYICSKLRMKTVTLKNYLPTESHLHFLFYVEEWEQWESQQKVSAKCSSQ